MGKAFEKQIKTIEQQGKKQVHPLKVLEPQAIESESNKYSITKEIYDEILQGRMDEIVKMSKEINYSRLLYNFKDPTSSITFSKFGGPMYTDDQ